MLCYLFFSILYLTSLGAFHYELLTFSLKMSQYLFISEKILICVTFDVRTTFKSNFHHDIFQFQVCCPEIGLLITSRAFIVQSLTHTTPAIEGVTVLTADRVIHEHCANWTTPFLLIYFVCKLHKLKVFKQFLICRL